MSLKFVLKIQPDFPMIHIDTTSLGLPIEYFKGSHVVLSKLWCISVPEGYINQANSVDPIEMQHYAFHLGLHCLLKYLFRNFQYTKCNQGL